MSNLNQSYSDVLEMPTIERRFFLETMRQQNIKAEENISKQTDQVKSTGKGTRTRTISGGDVKNYSNKV